MSPLYFLELVVPFPRAFTKAATAGGRVVSKSSADGLHGFDNKLLTDIDRLNKMVLLPGGQTLICSYSTGEVCLYRNEERRSREDSSEILFEMRYPVHALGLSPDGTTLIAGDGSSVILWNLASNEQKSTFALDMMYQYCAALNNHGAYVICSMSGTIISSLSQLPQYCSMGGLESAAISEDGKRIVTSYREHFVQILDLEKQTAIMLNFTVQSINLAISTDWIVMGCWNTVVVHSIKEDKAVARLTGFEFDVMTVELSSCGKFIVACTVDAEMKLWKIES